MKKLRRVLLVVIAGVLTLSAYQIVSDTYFVTIPTQDNSSKLSTGSSSSMAQSSERPSSSSLPSSSEASVGVSYTDEQLAALDNKSQGWGQGLNKNNKNQPVGSISFQKKYGDYDSLFIGKDEKVIYLTFDEGYENGYTASILDTLKAKNIKAVFFVTYDYAKRQSDLVRRMIDEGHVVGNHSNSHKSYPTLSISAAKEDLISMHNYVKDNFGYEMTLFRFPEGTFSERMLALVQSQHYKSIFWSYAYKDWVTTEQIGKEAAYQKVVSNLHDGAIYLLHAVSSDNAAMLGDFIDEAKRQGYVFDTSL